MPVAYRGSCWRRAAGAAQAPPPGSGAWVWGALRDSVAWAEPRGSDSLAPDDAGGQAWCRCRRRHSRHSHENAKCCSPCGFDMAHNHAPVSCPVPGANAGLVGLAARPSSTERHCVSGVSGLESRCYAKAVDHEQSHSRTPSGCCPSHFAAWLILQHQHQHQHQHASCTCTVSRHGTGEARQVGCHLLFLRVF